MLLLKAVVVAAAEVDMAAVDIPRTAQAGMDPVFSSQVGTTPSFHHTWTLSPDTRCTWGPYTRRPRTPPPFLARPLVVLRPWAVLGMVGRLRRVRVGVRLR
jgi:hypothetical protein